MVPGHRLQHVKKTLWQKFGLGGVGHWRFFWRAQGFGLRLEMSIPALSVKRGNKKRGNLASDQFPFWDFHLDTQHWAGKQSRPQAVFLHEAFFRCE